MIVTTVEIYVRKEKIGDFIEATIKNHNASVKEPGNLRFDVLQSINDPARLPFMKRMNLKNVLLRTKKPNIT